MSPRSLFTVIDLTARSDEQDGSRRVSHQLLITYNEAEQRWAAQQETEQQQQDDDVGAAWFRVEATVTLVSRRALPLDKFLDLIRADGIRGLCSWATNNGEPRALEVTGAQLTDEEAQAAITALPRYDIRLDDDD